MSGPWNDGVRGSQVLPLINNDATVIRVEAGPGTGKTFGLVRRVLRILHAEGLNVPAKNVLVIAFNRVIAKQLESEISAVLVAAMITDRPTVKTVHSLCLEVTGEDTRILLPHEREAMIYDVLTAHPSLRTHLVRHAAADSALAMHEARHCDQPCTEHNTLWLGVQEWLDRHRSRLISELPQTLVDRLNLGDLEDMAWSHIIVDEFQDLTPGEQQLVFLLRTSDGSVVALGDPRQSIYAFRGNDKDGLRKIEAHTEGTPIADLTMTECQRCPDDIVDAANHLTGLSPAAPLVAVTGVKGDIAVLTWPSPAAEALGMANAIIANVGRHPQQRHLVMVTRRTFGYMLRDEIAKIDADVAVEMTFSEGMLETWAVREAFIFLCAAVDPDAPTWRGWFAYSNSESGTDYKSAQRNAPAYLNLLTACTDVITRDHVKGIAIGDIPSAGGTGAQTLRNRAVRFRDVFDRIDWSLTPKEVVAAVLSEELWIRDGMADAETARLDLDLLRQHAESLLTESLVRRSALSATQQLQLMTKRLRYVIATREGLPGTEENKLRVATLWGAKGVTADHVYVIGLVDEALPGVYRDEYPGTFADFIDEQRRLFFVSLTRARSTLVLSRFLGPMRRGEAQRLGLRVPPGKPWWVPLRVTRYLADIAGYLPAARHGADWLSDRPTEASH